MEQEPELGDEGSDDQSPEEPDSQQDQQGTPPEFIPPKMKLCLRKVAAGLRIRSGPSFVVG